jgi:beta-lactamase regulating signal transducer with metallopeptidase domain
MEFILELKIADLIFEYLIKSSLLLLVSFLMVSLFRHKSASLKHFILSFSLISLLLFPLLSSLKIGWETPLLPSWSSEPISSSAANKAPDENELYFQRNFAEKNTSENNTLLSGSTETGKDISGSLWHGPLKNILGLSMLLLWSIGLLFLLARIFLGLYSAHRLTRQGKKILSFSWQKLMAKLLKSLSLKRKINLFRHNRVKFPLTWGVIKPVIIMPDESTKWTRDQCTSVLLHELSHIKRGDFLIKVIARISCAVFWFNPLSWITYKRMKMEQEKACDEFVIKAGVRPSTYAANLISIKKSGQVHWHPPALVLEAMGENQFQARLTAILRKQFKTKEIKMKTKIMLSLTVILLMIVIGLARPARSIASAETTNGYQDISPGLIQQSVQEKKIDVQEKEQKKESKEAQKKEEKEKKKNIWITKDGKSITIISKDGSKKIYFLDGDKIDIHEDLKGNWTISCDELKFPKGDNVKIIKLKKGHGFHVIDIDTDKDTKGKKRIIISPRTDVHADVFLDFETNEKLNEKIKEIQEKIQKITEAKVAEAVAEIETQTLREVEEVLAKVSEELAHKSKMLKDIEVSLLHEDEVDIHDHIKEIKEIDVHKHIYEDGNLIVAVTHKDEGIQIKIKTGLNGDHKLEYKKIVERLKKELPEGYKVESEFDEEGNTFSITVTGDSKDKEKEIAVQDLVKKISEQLEKVKDSSHRKILIK